MGACRDARHARVKALEVACCATASPSPRAKHGATARAFQPRQRSLLAPVEHVPLALWLAGVERCMEQARDAVVPHRATTRLHEARRYVSVEEGQHGGAGKAGHGRHGLCQAAIGVPLSPEFRGQRRRQVACRAHSKHTPPGDHNKQPQQHSNKATQQHSQTATQLQPQSQLQPQPQPHSPTAPHP